MPYPTDIDYFSTSKFFVHKALISLLNGSSASNFERFDFQVERTNWTEISPSLNKSCECDSRKKSTLRTSTVLLWCEIDCAKKPDRGFRLIGVGNTFRLWSAKCSRYQLFESPQASRQVDVGSKMGAQLA